MKARLIGSLLALACAAGAVGAVGADAGPSARAARNPGSRPTHAEVVAAVNRAKRSKALWATINLCNPRGHRGQVGVRGQMPSLGFPSRLVMVFRLYYWSPAQHDYAPVRDSRHAYVVGRSADATIQYGISYTFTAKVTLIGQITFKWFRGPRELGEATLFTSGGHPQVSDAVPRGYSVATCTV